MKKIAILGFLVMLMPFLGFSITWENIIYLILGFLIFAQSIYFSMKTSLFVSRREEKSSNNTYVENGDCSIDGK